MDFTIHVCYGNSELEAARRNCDFMIMPDGQGRSVAYLRNTSLLFPTLRTKLDPFVATERLDDVFTVCSLGLSAEELISKTTGIGLSYPGGH